MAISKWINGIALPALLCVAVSAPAQTFTYPVQEFRMGIGNTNRNIAMSATASGAPLASSVTTGERSEKWYLNYVSSGVYEIVNSQTAYVVTNQNGKAVAAPDVNGANQRWNIVAVSKDFEGYNLYYKIVSNADASVGLTFVPSGNEIAVSTYGGDNYQKFKLNLDGLEGFAANSLVGGKEKAGAIGGLLGTTEYVSTVAQLVAALNKTVPLTVVLTADIDMATQSSSNQRIRDDKTLVGSYAKNTIYDCQLRNDDYNGKDAAPSNNIVIRNMNFVAKTLNSTGSGVILLYVYGGRNIWIDHNDFSATFGQNSSVEVGKFIWINTPAANWSDAAYNGVNPDYITISYNYMKNRFWTVAFGSQNKDVSRLRTTLMFNKWEQCSRRTPQYSNGFHHNYSEYHTVTGGSNPNASSQIIAGEGSRVLSENCRFEAYKGKEIDIDRTSALSYFDYNSYTAATTSATPTKISITTLGTAWKATDNYGYALVPGYDASGYDVKAFCNAYSGCFKSYDKIKYVTDAEVIKYVGARHPASFLKTVAVDSLKTGAVLDTAFKYVLKNVNSGRFLAVASALASDGAGVVQRDSAQTWKFSAAGAGYYFLHPQIGDGRTLRLDLDSGKIANGTKLDVVSAAGSDARMFKLVANGDGSYTIVTKISKDRSCIGIAAGSTQDGADAVEWESTGSQDQKWVLEARVDPINGTLIRNLIVKDVENSADWKIARNVQLGSLVFGDRDFTYGALPPEIVGAEAILTACDSKASIADLATFTAGADATIYVALDSRVTTIPVWLGAWTKMESSVSSNNGVTFNLYRKSAKSGDVVTLGTNGQSTSSLNYTVFAVSNGTTASRRPGTIASSLAARLDRSRLVVRNETDVVATLSVFSVAGEKFGEFVVDGRGEYSFPLGKPLSKGTYLIKVRSASFQETTPMSVE